LLVAALLILAVGCTATESPPPPPTTETQTSDPVTDRPIGEPFRIVFLGDSLSAGFGLPESEAFPALVQERLRQKGHPVDVLNAGVSGDTTAGGLARLDWVLRSEPHLLVIELGGNDALRGQSLENTETNLREIVRRGRDSGARILLLGMDVPTNYGSDYGSEFAAVYRRIADDEDVALLPAFMREVGLNRRLLMPDGLHPTAEGHRRLADSLVDAIQELLPSR
jgi:acyl-CoA thioesterase-1